MAPAADIPGLQVACIRADVVPEVGAGLQDRNVGKVEMEDEYNGMTVTI